MIHKREILSRKEKTAQELFLKQVSAIKRKTKQPVMVALIGLVSSGKSSVAKELAKHLGAIVLEGDQIRIELRKQNEKYERARAIAENVAVELVKQGSNVILDSDFIDQKKRASLRERARQAGAKVLFVCTYADLDVMIGRIISTDYHNQPGDFFGGASSKWEGDDQSKGAVVKLREMFRRLPLHYKWVNQGGGRWEIKNPPCTVVADIDTTDPEEWKREVKKCAEKIISS